MANYIATDTQFNATADAIRAKTGSNAAIEWDEDTGFADDIAAISAGVDVSGVTATPADVLSPKVFVDENGDEQTGTIATKSSSDLTASGATVSVPAGYYPTDASKSVTSGSAGTPTATKGTVSNNQVTVTPAVTNTTGYITGGTKTGTAVTVKASELVSGTKTISGSGSTDVTNYASASVAAGSATAPSSISGSSATVSTGTNTLTLTKTVSVTPSVSAGYVSAGTAGNSSVSLTASVTTKAAATLYPSSSDQTISSGQYLTGAQTIKAVKVTNLTAANIKSGVTVQVGDASDPDRVASVTGTLAMPSTISTWNPSKSLVQGTIKDTGYNGTNVTNRIRSSNYIQGVSANFMRVKLPHGFKLIIFEYSSAAASGFIKRYPSSSYATTAIVVDTPTNKYYRFLIGKTDDTDLSPTDFNTSDIDICYI